jgi:outer membrane protein OmpA-like peptidoglycan-associated protein
MAISLLNQLMNDLKGDSLGNIASALGETPARTESALGAALPALISGLAGKASTTSQATSLLDTIKRNNLDSGIFGDPASALSAPGGITGLINMGRPLLDSVFGGRTGSVAEWMTSRSGISRSSSSTLMSLGLPIVLGMIAKRLKNSGWSASNLMTMLDEQRSLLPDTPGLGAALSRDFTHVDTDERERPTYVPPRHEPTHAEVVHARETKSRRGSSSWLWALPLLFLIPLLGYFLSRGDERRVADTRPAPQVAIPRVPLAEPVRPVEPVEPVGTSGVAPTDIGPYRLEFQTGSSRFTRASANELREVANLLKAHPQARAAVNGYTDDSGDDAANLRLSEARANATMEQLAGLGVDRSRMTAQGYGESHPVADNATAEGRQRNRRVEISVTNR